MMIGSRGSIFLVLTRHVETIHEFDRVLIEANDVHPLEHAAELLRFLGQDRSAQIKGKRGEWLMIPLGKVI